MKLNNKYVIGYHVMWYEIEMIDEAIDALKDAIEPVENRENITVDLCFNESQYIEKIDERQYKMSDLHGIFFNKTVDKLDGLDINIEQSVFMDSDSLYGIGSYRRELNYRYCNTHDYVIWGESDCLVPKNLFKIIEKINQYTTKEEINRHCITFATRKMWDDSWKILEHNDFTDKPYYDLDEEKWKNEPSSIWYTMSKEEMNNINNDLEGFDIRIIDKPRFEGSCLIISSDLLKSGINIPAACSFIDEDTAFQYMIRIIMGDKYRQFIIKNVLKVHNRNHPNKREYILNEKDKKYSKHRRQSNKIYDKFSNVSKFNLNNLVNSQKKFLEFKK